MPERVLHQFTEGVYTGDAVSDHAFAIRRWLRSLGFVSDIFAERIQPELAADVRPAGTYQPRPAETCVIHHHAVGSLIADRLAAIELPQILIYHNITPPEFFEATDPALAEGLRRGRNQLQDMRPRTILGLGVSPYNRQELVELGYDPTGVLPIFLDESHLQQPVNETLASVLGATHPTLLFVGRFAPNKRQEDLIKLLYFLRRARPDARLILVGNTSNENYVNWIRSFARELGLDQVAVHITGHISGQDMLTCYRCADVYVSMSEHEGFGKPLIESMYCGLPVVAYAAGAVPSTMAGAGILFNNKDYEALTELIDLLMADDSLRRRVIVRQMERSQVFLEPNVRRQFESYLHQLNLLPDHPAP